MILLRSIFLSVQSVCIHTLLGRGGALVRRTTAGIVLGLVFVLGGCEMQTQIAGGAPRFPASPVGFVGRWTYDVQEPGPVRTRTFEFAKDGRYMECSRGVGTTPSRRPEEFFVCQSGRWWDLGSMTALHPGVDPGLAGVHLLALDPVVFDSSQAWVFHRYEGINVARVGDSLIQVGSFRVFRGGWGRMDSTLWQRPGGDLDDLILWPDGSAVAATGGRPSVAGQWDTLPGSTLRMTYWLERYPRTFQGLWALSNNSLLFTELEPITTFTRTTAR